MVLNIVMKACHSSLNWSMDSPPHTLVGMIPGIIVLHHLATVMYERYNLRVPSLVRRLNVNKSCVLWHYRIHVVGACYAGGGHLHIRKLFASGGPCTFSMTVFEKIIIKLDTQAPSANNLTPTSSTPRTHAICNNIG